MAAWQMQSLIVAAALGISSPCYADECDALAATLTEKISHLSIADRTTNDQAVAISFKHPDADQLALVCPTVIGTPSQTPRLSAQSNATWPPSRFYDLLASAGAIVVSNSQPAVRSGSILCAQRAMQESGHNVFDVNNARFECASSAGATHIIISRIPLPPPQ
jgi:hypothetical protein